MAAPKSSNDKGVDQEIAKDKAEVDAAKTAQIEAEAKQNTEIARAKEEADLAAAKQAEEDKAAAELKEQQAAEAAKAEAEARRDTTRQARGPVARPFLTKSFDEDGNIVGVE